MGFANNSIPLGQVDTDLFICPVALEASVHTLILGNSSDTPVSVTIKRYDHSLGQTFNLIPNIAVVKGSPWHLPAPLNLVSGDKLIAVASDDGVVASGDGFISGAPDAITFNMRGPWNSSHTYKKFDVVSYQGRSFVFWSSDESTTTPPLESGQWVLLTDHAPIFFDGTIPSPNGVAATGTSDAVARADHVHPAQTAANTPVTSASQGVETVQQAIDDLVATKADASHTHDVSEITGLGSAALEDTSAFASAGQGALADTAVQPNTDPVFSSVTIDNNTQSHLFFQRDGKNRWMVGTDGSDEPGDNTGGNFGIARYDDSGAFLGYSMAFLRQYPNAFFWSPPVVPNYTTDALPPAGIQGGLAFDATVLRPAYDNGTSWVHLLTSDEADDFATAAQGVLADTAVQPDDLEAYAPLANPALTGIPTAPKPGSSDDSDQIATTGWVTDRIEAVIDGAPAALDTLKEIADKLDDNDDAIGAIISAIADKADADHTHTVSEISGLGTAATRAATDFATAAQGAKADTAVQPGDLAAVATSGAYADLTGRPALGTAAGANTADFATAAQGAKADTAVQPDDLATVAVSGAYADLTGRPDLGTAAGADIVDFATAVQGAKADTAVQPGALTAYAPLASPAFSGVPTAPTPTPGDVSTKIATTAFVTTTVATAGSSLAVRRVSSNTAILSSDRGNLVQMIYGGQAVTLPSISEVGNGFYFYLQNAEPNIRSAPITITTADPSQRIDDMFHYNTIYEYSGGSLKIIAYNNHWTTVRLSGGAVEMAVSGNFYWPTSTRFYTAQRYGGGGGGGNGYDDAIEGNDSGGGGGGGGALYPPEIGRALPPSTVSPAIVGAGGTAQLEGGATTFLGRTAYGGGPGWSKATPNGGGGGGLNSRTATTAGGAPNYQTGNNLRTGINGSGGIVDNFGFGGGAGGTHDNKAAGSADYGGGGGGYGMYTSGAGSLFGGAGGGAGGSKTGIPGTSGGLAGSRGAAGGGTPGIMNNRGGDGGTGPSGAGNGGGGGGRDGAGGTGGFPGGGGGGSGPTSSLSYLPGGTGGSGCVRVWYW